MRFATVLVMAGLVPEAVKTWIPAPNPRIKSGGGRDGGYWPSQETTS